MNELSPETRLEVEGFRDLLVDPSVDADDKHFSIVECADGEAPVIRQFTTPEALGERMQLLQAMDMYAIPFFGKCLPYSTGNVRYLFLQDGEVLAIPKSGKISREEVYKEEVEMQEDYFIGPSYYLEAGTVSNPFLEEESELDDFDDDEVFDDEDLEGPDDDEPGAPT